MKAIASRDNAAYKALARLIASAAERKREQLSVLDGAHLLKACLDSGLRPERVFASRSGLEDAEVQQLLARCEGVPMLSLTDPLFDALSTVETPTGVMAVVRTPHGREAKPDAKLALLLEEIQDPGNVGALLRSAAAAGADHVLLSPHCAFAWSPKVLRAGMGAHFAVNIVEAVDLVSYVRAFRGQSIALAGGGKQDLYELDLRGPVAFLVGNEGAGLSAGLAAAASVQACIPMSPRKESLNAAAAGAIALFEAARQRRMRA
jgi:RNA methyltransferase, TrmH family